MNKMNLKAPVLVYHEIVNDGEITKLANVLQWKYIVERSVFEKQLQYLHDNDYKCFTISEMLALIGNYKHNLACITFDDGYIGNFSLALPLLKKYGFKATFFIVSNWVGTEHMMTWEQIKALIDEGMEIGSHTNSHRLLEACDRETIQNELIESRENIKKYLSYNTRLVSYPNGSYTGLVNEIAKNIGYSAALTSDFGYLGRKKPPFAIKRIFITNDIESIVKTTKAGSWFLFTSYFTGSLKKALKLILGRLTYDRLYNRLFNITVRP